MTAAAHHSETPPALSQRTLARLDRLGQRVRLNGLGHRRLSEGDARQLAAALLRDIDETILPRHMNVTTNAGQSFTLDISGRRLLRLVSAGGGHTLGEPADPVEAAKVLAGDLKRGLLRATEVTLQSHRMDSAAERSGVGSSAQDLASALGIDLDALEGERMIDKAIRSLGRHAASVVIMNGRGRVSRRIGNTEISARIEALAADHVGDMVTTVGQILEPGRKSGCMTIGTDNESGGHLVFAVCDNALILAVVEPRQVDALLPVLQDIFAK